MMLRAVCSILELNFFYEMCVVPKNDDFEFRRGRLFYKKMFWPIFSYDIELHFYYVEVFELEFSRIWQFYLIRVLILSSTIVAFLRPSYL